MRYYAFADESRITGARYRSIASVSLPVDCTKELSDLISTALVESGVGEFKWADVNGARERFCGLKLLDIVLDKFLACRGRIDVLVWDTQDARHKVRGRDDMKNFERMFFHLHRRLMERRELAAEWHLRPDERFGVDWGTVQQCLHSVGGWKKYFDQSLLSEEWNDCFFRVGTFKEVKSHETPLSQVADLFAGMAPYARERCELIRAQLDESDGQVALFSDAVAAKPSARDRERFRLIKHLYDGAKARHLGVSLRTRGYLHTADPTQPLNFWHYVPQHSSDRAPTRD